MPEKPGQSGWSMEELRARYPDCNPSSIQNTYQQIKSRFETRGLNNAHPLMVPGGLSYLDFALLLSTLAEDEWCLTHLEVLAFNSTTGAIIAISHKEDRSVWDHPNGHRHLRTQAVRFYDLGVYANLVMQQYLQENPATGEV